MELLQDTHVWFAGSFAAFLVIAWIFGRKAILGALDSRINAIREEIKTAEVLNAEARQLFAEYEEKHRDALNMAARIKANAEKDAEEVRRRADEDLTELTERRERQLEERLSRMKQSAIAEIQQYAADLAAAATAEIIAKQLDKKTGEKLVERSIDNIDKNLH